MFRGGLGQSLKMITHHEQTDSLFYHMYMREVRKRGYSKPPKPVLLVPPFFGKALKVEKDATLDLDVFFFGEYIKFLPELILGINILGKMGLGSERHYNKSRFEISSIKCKISKRLVYDGSNLILNNLSSIDVKDIPPYDEDRLKIGFRTPLTSKPFPPKAERLLFLIRNRLLGFVNEYGSGEEVPEFKCKGDIINYSSHKHKLERRSIRSEKTLFKGYTGIVEYKFTELDDSARWLINVGLTIGCGPDSSFGFGFLQKMP